MDDRVLICLDRGGVDRGTMLSCKDLQGKMIASMWSVGIRKNRVEPTVPLMYDATLRIHSTKRQALSL